MGEKTKFLSDEQLNFLKELMNIGAGNAAVAFSQMLQCDVNMRIPRVRVLSVTHVPHHVFDDPALSVACVRMRLVGRVTGDLFFIVRDDQKRSLIRLMERASGLPSAESIAQNSKSPVDLSVLTEIGNILAGVYLTTVHDFSKLNIYHTVPSVAVDMLQSLIDESLATLSREVEEVIMIQNDFITAEEDVTTFFLIIPSRQSVKTLVDSIEEAWRGMMRGGDETEKRRGDKK